MIKQAALIWETEEDESPPTHLYHNPCFFSLIKTFHQELALPARVTPEIGLVRKYLSSLISERGFHLVELTKHSERSRCIYI